MGYEKIYAEMNEEIDKLEHESYNRMMYFQQIYLDNSNDKHAESECRLASGEHRAYQKLQLKMLKQRSRLLTDELIASSVHVKELEQ